MKRKIFYVTTFLIVINVLVFIAEIPFGGSTAKNFFTENLTMYSPMVKTGQWWRIFTSMFLHFGPIHLLMNMMALYNLGYYLEDYLGKFKYLIVYIVGGIGGNLAVLLADQIMNTSPMCAGASGAIFAVLGGILSVALRDKYSGLSIPNVLSSVVFALAPGFFIQGISMASHVGGLIFGFILGYLLQGSRKHVPKH